MQFTPLKDFFSEELKSQYCVGLSYTGRPEDTRLAVLVRQWIGEGKVRPGAPEAPIVAKVAGSGKVK